MLKKLSVVFIVLLIIIAAASVAYAGNPEGIGDTGASSKTSNVSAGTTVNAPATSPSGTAQKDGGSLAGSNTGGKNAGAGEAITAPATAGKETGAAKAGGAEKEEDPDAKLWRAIMKVLESGEPVDNGQLIALITSPENIGDEVTIYEDQGLVISGFTEYTDVELLIARLNKETGVYEIIVLPDGDRTIDTSTGAFSTELELGPGKYNLLLIAYRTSEKDPDRVQYTPISVKVLKSYLRWLGIGKLFGAK